MKTQITSYKKARLLINLFILSISFICIIEIIRVIVIFDRKARVQELIHVHKLIDEALIDEWKSQSQMKFDKDSMQHKRHHLLGIDHARQLIENRINELNK